MGGIVWLVFYFRSLVGDLHRLPRVIHLGGRRQTIRL